ncbi:MAG: IPT/TIG domain-containing protein, partial [Candidatus Levybacteria bacterium]|nr:IPT/TIG domain-containing protein [Candidatus Levybacteria bacterium]
MFARIREKVIALRQKIALSNKKLIGLVIVLLTVIALPLIVIASQQEQDIRQHASEPTSSPNLTNQQEASSATTKDAEQIELLTNQLFQFNKKLTGDVGSLSEEDQTARNRATANLTEIAKKRKALLLQVIEEDPELFLSIALKQTMQSSMPAAIQEYLEKEVTVEGKTEVLHIDDFKNPANSRFNYFLKIGNEKINLFPTQELPIPSGVKVRIKGIQLDNNIVTTADSMSFQVLEAAPKPESVGDQKTLVLLIRFKDSGDPPFTKEKAHDLIFNGQFQKFYKEQSYNQVSFSGDVFGWFSLTYNNTHQACDVIYSKTISNVIDIPKLVADNNIELGIYSRLIFVVDTNYSGCSFVGTFETTINGKTYRFSEAAVGAHNYTNPWFNHPFEWTELDFTLSHELGHSLGVLHANGWDCKDQTLYGDCTHIEYGNYFDTMGIGSFSLHFNAFYKELLGWMNSSSTLLISTSGVYTLNPLELDSDKKFAKIQIQNSNVIPYDLEYRKGIGFDANLNNVTLLSNQSGLFINHIMTDPALPLNYSYTHLLDITPSSKFWADDIDDAALNGEKIFTDPGRGIAIGPIIKTDASSITFEVNLAIPSCVRQKPLASTVYISNPVVAGGFGTIDIKLTNADGFGCGESKFHITPTLPLGWKIIDIHPSDNIVIDADGKSSIYITFNPPENTPVGDYSLSYDIVNLQSGLKTHAELTTTIKPALKISKIDPQTGNIGTEITIFGSGFSEDASYNKISFSNPQGYAITNSKLFQLPTNEQVLKFTVPETICASGGLGAPGILGGGCSPKSTPSGTYGINVYNDFSGSNTMNFQVIEPPTPTPDLTPIPINWKTDSVSLQADNFFIKMDNRIFKPNSNFKLHSDSGKPTFTTSTLEATWLEGKTEMRLFIYFSIDANNQWKVTEMRTYDGKTPGNWLYYLGGESGKLGV